MPGIEELAGAARAAFAVAAAEPDVREVEIFAAANTALLARLCYTSHIPCNGVEEPKSLESAGLGIRAVLDGPDGPRVGFGSEPGEPTVEAARRALARARAAAVRDPDFVSLPRPGAPRGPVAPPAPDRALMTLDDAALVGAGWTVVHGALRTFLASTRLADLAGGEEALRRLGLIVSGDVTVVQERVAIVSTHLPHVQTDESALMTAFVTAMVEARDAKGSGWWTGTRLDEFSDEAGADAARRAIDAIDGERIPSGRYTVVLGPQPVTDLVDNLVVPALTASAFVRSRTPFAGRLGRRVAAPGLHVYDDGSLPGRLGTKAITCEGLPTGRTDLIRDGVLVGCLANWYESRRLLADPLLDRKLGATGPAAEAAVVPRNGFRFGAGGGRRFDVRPGIAASNVVVEGADPVGLDELLRRVGDGLYVGRIWYTYPINGLAAGDFTCTVVGDSYIIRDGRLAAPLRANAVRINDNIATILDRIVGTTKDARGTIVWAADEVVYAPEIAVAGVRVDEIAGFMEGLSR
jgi:PmbA protein